MLSGELISPTIFLPSGQAKLSFRQNYNLQSNRDGGVLEIKIGGGAFTDIITAGGSFINNGYTGTLMGGSGNSLAGRSAWSGNSGGFVTTDVSLPAGAANQLIQFKWRLSTDNSTSSASITNTNGNHTVSAPLSLSSSGMPRRR